MSDSDLVQDLVLLFDSAGATVQQEFRLADFERLRDGELRLAERAGASVRAVYATVEPGLRVAALVFFLLPIDSDGAVATSFNIPLEYLAEHAGARTDLGIGVARIASKAQCPVPWLAIKLWEPEARDDGPARVVQRAVMLNRLGLRSNPVAPVAPVAVKRADAPAAESSLRHSASSVERRVPGGPSSRIGAGPAVAASAVQLVADAEPARFATAVPEVVPRDAAGAIDQGHLEQLRRLRAEVLELKAALRGERERNRRLQALLRGEL